MLSKFLHGKKKQGLIFLTAVLVVSLLVVLNLLTPKNQFVLAESSDWNNYDVVRDSETDEFIGINIKDSTSGALSVTIPEGSATVSTGAGLTGWRQLLSLMHK